MALYKEKTLDNGSVGSYWKIVKIDIHRLSGSVVFSIDLFKESSYAASGVGNSLNCLKTFKGSFTAAQIDSNVVELGYALIKAQVLPFTIAMPGFEGEPIVETIHPCLDLEGATDC